MALAQAQRSCSSSCVARSSARMGSKMFPNARRLRSSLRVAAVQQQDSNTDSRVPQGSFSTIHGFQKSYDRFREKYEQSILSAGVGALSVTCYAVYKGQSPVEAAGITACATIMALVSFHSCSKLGACRKDHLGPAVGCARMGSQVLSDSLLVRVLQVLNEVLFSDEGSS